MTITNTTRSLTIASVLGATISLSSSTAWAHLNLEAPGATAGKSAVMTFRVATESDTARTTKLVVHLPGFKSARTEPMPGWTASIDRDEADLATTVTWTAAPEAGPGPTEFQRFYLSAGPLPDQESVKFTAEQTYSDGSVMVWDQPVNPDGSEPEFPAPVLKISKPATPDTSTQDTDKAESALVAAQDGPEDTPDLLARWLGAGGLLAGVVGIGMWVSARRTRSTNASTN